MDGSAGQEPDCPWRLGVSVGLCTLLPLSRALRVNERRQIPFHSNLEGLFSVISLFDSLPSRKTYQIRDPCGVGDSRVCLQACLPLAKCVGKPGCGARVSAYFCVRGVQPRGDREPGRELAREPVSWQPNGGPRNQEEWRSDASQLWDLG